VTEKVAGDLDCRLLTEVDRVAGHLGQERAHRRHPALNGARRDVQRSRHLGLRDASLEFAGDLYEIRCLPGAAAYHARRATNRKKAESSGIMTRVNDPEINATVSA